MNEISEIEFGMSTFFFRFFLTLMNLIIQTLKNKNKKYLSIFIGSRFSFLLFFDFVFVDFSCISNPWRSNFFGGRRMGFSQLFQRLGSGSQIFPLEIDPIVAEKLVGCD